MSRSFTPEELRGHFEMIEVVGVLYVAAASIQWDARQHTVGSPHFGATEPRSHAGTDWTRRGFKSVC